MILGLTGSLGSGKSAVAGWLAEMGGAVIIDADQITRELQQPGQPAFQKIAETFGPGIIAPDGNLDRKKLADIVFSDEEKREQLNGIIHPMVIEETLKIIELHENKPLKVVMAPLLYEAGMDTICGKVAVVTVDETPRMQRLAARGMPANEASRRLAAQMGQAEKARRADFVIDNSGTLEAGREQAADLLRKLGIIPRQKQHQVC